MISAEEKTMKINFKLDLDKDERALIKHSPRSIGDEISVETKKGFDEEGRFVAKDTTLGPKKMRFSILVKALSPNGYNGDTDSICFYCGEAVKEFSKNMFWEYHNKGGRSADYGVHIMIEQTSEGKPLFNIVNSNHFGHEYIKRGLTLEQLHEYVREANKQFEKGIEC